MIQGKTEVGKGNSAMVVEFMAKTFEQLAKGIWDPATVKKSLNEETDIGKNIARINGCSMLKAEDIQNSKFCVHYFCSFVCFVLR